MEQWEDQDVSKPIRGYPKMISRGSIKFVGRSSNYMSQTSVRFKPKEPEINASNLFGVNLME
jgi:hypothetical protein